MDIAIRKQTKYLLLMQTMTVKLPDEVAARLEEHAKRLGVSKSSIVRESLDSDLREPATVEEGASAYDLMKDGFGCVNSGIGDLSTNPKHMEGFGR